MLALMEMHVEGVSTRKVKEVTEELCGTSFSKSTVSGLAANLDAELAVWRERRLEAEAYPYVFVDARYEEARVGGWVVSQGVLVVSAVREPDGLREIVGIAVADTESEATYQKLFRPLKPRALWRGACGLRRRRRTQGGHLSPLSGGLLAEVPGPLREKPPRDGGREEAQGSRR